MPAFSDTVFMRLLAQREASRQQEQQNLQQAGLDVQRTVDTERSRRFKVAETAGKVAGKGGEVPTIDDPQMREVAGFTAQNVRADEESRRASAAAKEAAERARIETQGAQRLAQIKQQGANTMAVNTLNNNAGRYDKSLQRMTLMLRQAGVNNKDIENKIKMQAIRLREYQVKLASKKPQVAGHDMYGDPIFADPVDLSQDPEMSALDAGLSAGDEEIAADLGSSLKRRNSVVPPSKPKGGATTSVSTTTSTAGAPAQNSSSMEDDLANHLLLSQ